MDQGKWEEIMGFLKANQQKMDANQEMLARMDARMDVDKEEMMARMFHDWPPLWP
jgi:predicted Zn-dependent protease